MTVTGRAVAVTDEVIVWEDQTTPNGLGSVDQAILDGVLLNLETLILPRERMVFGFESDVDANRRIEILLSYTVNQYGAVAYVTQCDIGRVSGCGTSASPTPTRYPTPSNSTRASL